jgi:glycosyltransferase involved in cell wall biosynthesis
MGISISGFTFLKDVVKPGYPFMESIQSLLPLVDEMVVVVGKSSDETLNLVRSIQSDKIRIFETIWNEKMEQRGFVYAQQKMIGQYLCRGDWAFYLEGDEVLHEKDLENIRKAIADHHSDPRVEALYFRYYHFHCSPHYLIKSPNCVRSECRIIRNTIRSYAPDGLYWVVMDYRRKGRYPRAVPANAHIYHYGNCQAEEKKQLKVNQVSRYWSHEPPRFSYRDIDPKILSEFKGTHPAIMKDWIARECDLTFSPVQCKKTHMTARDWKYRASMVVESLLSVDLSKRRFVALDGSRDHRNV